MASLISFTILLTLFCVRSIYSIKWIVTVKTMYCWSEWIWLAVDIGVNIVTCTAISLTDSDTDRSGQTITHSTVVRLSIIFNKYMCKKSDAHWNVCSLVHNFIMPLIPVDIGDLSTRRHRPRSESTEAPIHSHTAQAAQLQRKNVLQLCRSHDDRNRMKKSRPNIGVSNIRSLARVDDTVAGYDL